MNPFRKTTPPPFTPPNWLLWAMLVLCVIVGCQSIVSDAFATGTAAMPPEHVPLIWGLFLFFLACVILPRRR